MLTLANNKNYYIQRVEKHIPEFKENKYGIDYFVSFDYMGSAEYEFGAVSRTWKFMKENFHEYKMETIPMELGGKTYNVFCVIPRDTDKEYMVDLFKGLYEYKYRTKEANRVCDIEDMVTDKTAYQVGWLNLITDYWSNEVPWFATVSPSIAFYWYKEMYLSEEDKEIQKERFENIQVGDKVWYPTYKENIFDIGTVIGFNDEGVTLKNYNRKRRYKANQVIITPKGRTGEELIW